MRKHSKTFNIQKKKVQQPLKNNASQDHKCPKRKKNSKKKKFHGGFH